MNYRDWLQQVIYKIINPVVHGMIRIGITPNFITTTGLVLNIVAACLCMPGCTRVVNWPM
jgi:CDP-diacylglycerol--glycerol-3-phosphate 3-phosphatidyltransferase